MFYNTKTTGNRDILHFYVKHMGLNIKNAIDHTNSNTTEIWHGTIKLTSRQTPYDSKL